MILRKIFNYFDKNRNCLYKELDLKILYQKSENYIKRISVYEFSNNIEIGE